MKVRRKSTGFMRLHRTTRMPETYMSTGALRFAHPARAVADAAREMNKIGDVRTVVYEAIQHTKCRAADLLAELRDGPTQRCSLLRAVLTEIATGIRSHAENDLRLLIKRGKVPQPMYNAKLHTLDGVFIAMVDAWWGEAGLAAEVDSRAYHTDHKAQDKDRNRHDMLIKHGVFPLHFSPQRIQHEGDGVLGDIRGALSHGENRPRLPIIALPADAAWNEDWAARARAMAAALAASSPAAIPARAIA
jgi:very-short-patch-repair endonuclease